MHKHFWAGALLALLAGRAAAQAPALTTPAQPWGSWVIATVQLPGTPAHRWGGYAELQGRSQALAQQFFYYETKGGVSFDIDPRFTVLLGAGRYSTSDYQAPEAGPLNVEKRLWQQLVLTQTTHRLKLEHRYRIEQRWFRFRNDSAAFRQRFRYRLNAFLPLNKKTITTGTLFLSVYDEVFLNPQGPVLERNRMYGGVGYQFSPHLTAQLGYVNQANYNYTNSQGQYVLQTTAAKNNAVLTVIYKLMRPAAAPGPARLPAQPD